MAGRRVIVFGGLIALAAAGAGVGTGIWRAQVDARDAAAAQALFSSTLPESRSGSKVRGSATSTVRCSVGFGVAVIRQTPSGDSKRCHAPCGTTTSIPALSSCVCGLSSMMMCSFIVGFLSLSETMASATFSDTEADAKTMRFWAEAMSSVMVASFKH